MAWMITSRWASKPTPFASLLERLGGARQRVDLEDEFFQEMLEESDRRAAEAAAERDGG